MYYTTLFLFPFFLFFLYHPMNELDRNRRRRENLGNMHIEVLYTQLWTWWLEEEKKKKRKRRGGVFGEEKKRRRREHYYCAVQSWPCHQQARLAVLQKSACLFSFSALCSDRERRKKKKNCPEHHHHDENQRKRNERANSILLFPFSLSLLMIVIACVKNMFILDQKEVRREIFFSLSPPPFLQWTPTIACYLYTYFFHHIFFPRELKRIVWMRASESETSKTTAACCHYRHWTNSKKREISDSKEKKKQYVILFFLFLSLYILFRCVYVYVIKVYVTIRFY